MKKLIKKDFKRRNQVNKYELKRLYLKSLLMDQTLSNKKRFKIQSELTKLPKNSSKVRLNNRCILTGRSRAVFKLFNLSRISLKQLALSGDLAGVKKTSW